MKSIKLITLTLVGVLFSIGISQAQEKAKLSSDLSYWTYCTTDKTVLGGQTGIILNSCYFNDINFIGRFGVRDAPRNTSYTFDQHRAETRISILVGLTKDIHPNFKVFSGIGYGRYDWYYQTLDFSTNELLQYIDIAGPEPRTNFLYRQGLELELGIMAHYKWLCITYGISTLNFSMIEFSFGIGLYNNWR